MVDPGADVGDSTIGLYTTSDSSLMPKEFIRMIPNKGPVLSTVKGPFFPLNRDLQNFLKFEHHDLLKSIRGVLVTCFFSPEPGRSGRTATMRSCA